MKKIILLLIVVSVIALTGCAQKLDYTDFESERVTTYYGSETISNNRYVLYYYNSEDDNSAEIKQEILSFFDGFDTLEYYLLDTSSIETESSNFGEYDGEPIVYIVSSNQVLEVYTGISEVREFIVKYSNIEFEYDLFEDQHVTTYEEILSIENDSYILYYYLDNCPYCIKAKPDVLPWAFTKSVEDIYFMEGSSILGADNLPTELIILNSGTPILVLMSNGEFADEYYSGDEPVVEYINSVGTGDIIPETMDFDYHDFSEHALDDYGDTLTISDNLHFEYYYSPYCGDCNSVKFKVLNFFNDLVNVEFYIINTTEADGIPKIPGFGGGPALYLVNDNEVVEEYIGAVQIPDFIKAYKNGEVDLSVYE